MPIPSAYTRDTSLLANCWYRAVVSFSYAAGGLNDFTTWSPTIGGSPVRLVKQRYWISCAPEQLGALSTATLLTPSRSPNRFCTTVTSGVRR